VARQLLLAAVDYAKERGANVIEAIPRGWRFGGVHESPFYLARMMKSAGFDSVDETTEGVHFRMSL
jgi:hypothetical protein